MAGISPATITKMGKNGHVTTEILLKICTALDCEIDDSLTESCVCGKEHLRYLFTIRNAENGNELYPIGSTCINKFDRDDLDYEVSVYEDMFRLIRAVENNEYIELSSIGEVLGNDINFKGIL